MALNRIQDTVAQFRANDKLILFALFMLGFAVFAFLAWQREEPVFFAFPFGLFAVYLAFTDLKALYLLLWFSIPFSTELTLPGGLGTDFPDEALMLLTAGGGFLFLLASLPKFNLRILFHPVCILLLLHYAWIWISTIQSDMPLVSLKFALAKSWYILVFFFLTYLFIKSERMKKHWFLVVMIPMALTIAVIFIRHTGYGLSFESINSVVGPFYRNHVTYAAIIAIFIPFLWFSIAFLNKKPSKWLWAIGLVASFIALYFTYTRAAYLAVMVAAAWYFIMRFRMTKPVLVLSLVGAGIFLVVMAKDNRYLDYEPDYAKTITHYKFENLIQATYQFEDISTMERFYRWIAGIYMLKEDPVFGFGPGNFYNYYKSFTDENFVTYVSDNPEKSGVHNYFLMTATDQGVPGFFIFISLCIAALLYGERLFHRLQGKRNRAFGIACILSLVAILFMQLFNDLIETDKIGSFFFFNLACLVWLDLENRKRIVQKSVE